MNWIKVEDKLPTPLENVWITIDRFGKPETIEGYLDESGEWFDSLDDVLPPQYAVVAWQSIIVPEPFTS